jgi:hypothetical protein
MQRFCKAYTSNVTSYSSLTLYDVPKSVIRSKTNCFDFKRKTVVVVGGGGRRGGGGSGGGGNDDVLLFWTTLHSVFMFVTLGTPPCSPLHIKSLLQMNASKLQTWSAQMCMNLGKLLV